MSAADPTIAVVMIARDESRCIERALLSVRGVADELLVLDTGSVDDTVRIARSSGARVERFRWVEDFAAARNAALEAADADWNLILDADEWLLDAGRAALAQIRHQAPQHVGLVETVSSYVLDGQPVSSVAVQERLLPRGVRYQGRVHEQPRHRLPVRASGVVLGHDGYEPAVAAGKRGRNEALLRRELQQRPGDPYLSYQLGKELQVADDFAGASDAYRVAYAADTGTAPWRHGLVVRYLYALKRAKRYAEAIEVMDAELPRWSTSPDVYFTLGDLFLDMSLDNPAQAGQLLPLIESSWLECLRLGDRPDLPGSVQGRGSYLAAHNLAAYYTSLGQVAKASEYTRLHDRLRRASQARLDGLMASSSRPKG